MRQGESGTNFERKHQMKEMTSIELDLVSGGKYAWISDSNGKILGAINLTTGERVMFG